MTDSGGVFSWAGIDDGLNNNLEWVLSGHEVNDFKRVSDDSDGHSLLTSVSTVEHKSIHESFNDWALGLSELLNLPSASSVRDENL